ncbi:uncharacterized protein V6R79_025541 [Siganus canaliculatus]
MDEPHTSCIGGAGVFKHSRESDNQRMNLTILPESQPQIEGFGMCEYCGEKAKPSLDLTWVQQPETDLPFCCAQRQQLCKTLMEYRCLVGGVSQLGTIAPRSDEDMEMEKLPIQCRQIEDPTRFTLDLPCGFREQSELQLSEDYPVLPAVAETISVAPASKVLSFRLSCPPGKGSWTVIGSSAAQKVKEEELVLTPLCPHKPVHFGVCHHQKEAEILQKDYSSSNKFLSVFPDGSAQAYYYSGLLALIVVVTEEQGRVCIVYDDCNVPRQPIRGLFLSDGRATCYHRNGNIWLTLNTSGGQCFTETGARVRQWSWDSPSFSPMPFHPIFLPLNKTVGVRVLGRKQVFVSFLSKGRQTKFNVGSCCTQDGCKINMPPSKLPVLKEEIFVLAARIRIHLVIQQLHRHLRTSSHLRPLKSTQAPHLQVAARRLLAASADDRMSDSDRTFILKCLGDCL